MKVDAKDVYLARCEEPQGSRPRRVTGEQSETGRGSTVELRRPALTRSEMEQAPEETGCPTRALNDHRVENTLRREQIRSQGNS